LAAAFLLVVRGGFTIAGVPPKLLVELSGEIDR